MIICSPKKKYLFLLVIFASCTHPKSDHRINYLKDESSVIEYVFDDDTLISIRSFKKDSITLDGASFFFKGNKLYKQAYFCEGLLCGSHHEYYDNGKIKTYICHDSFEDTMIYRQYDTFGNIINEKGGFDAPTTINYDLWKTNRIIIVTTSIVQAPFVSFNNESGIIFNNKDTLRPYKDNVLYDWQHNYYFKADSPGTYLYWGKISFVDSAKKNTYIYHSSCSSKKLE